MDTQYGIAVTNKFCLFDDDDEVDPYEILKQEEEKRNEALAKEKTDKTKPNKKTKKSAPQTENKNKLTEQNIQKKEDKSLNQSQPRTQQNDRPPRSARQPRENQPREDRRPRRQDENTSSNEPRDKPEGGFGGRLENRGGFSGRPRGRGGPRGGRGRGGFGGGFGKREFERHSGSDRTSGVKPTEKRDGMGAHNWGTFKDDLDEEATKENEEPKEWNPTDDTENQDPNESSESTEQPTSEGEKTPKQMTLDEWKAMEDKKRMKADFKIRKANEGSDQTQFKGSVYRKPVNESDDDEEDDEEYEEEDEHKQKNQLPIRITFNDSPRRGGRGGRRPRGGRGPRGSMGRGDRRGGPRDTAPRFDDEADFPSLVKSAA